VAGNFGIPAADFSGTPTGLSANGRTLVLEQFVPNPPARFTQLVVVDTRRLAVRERIALPGWSTVDAISPDGRWLYLIHYRSSYDLTKYQVLAYNLTERRLLAKPVVDPRDRGEAMAGVPISRVMSPGGRWDYTLYIRPSGEPFVHALDTKGLRAVCIDLPSLNNANLGTAHLQLGPGARSLEVNLGGFIGAAINARTFAVSRGVSTAAPAPAKPASHDARASGGGNGPPWALVLVALAVAAVLGAGARRVTRARAAA
jgi:hypothetical protein